MTVNYVEKFSSAANSVGAEVHQMQDLDDVVDYLQARAGDKLLLSPCSSLMRTGLAEKLKAAQVGVIDDRFREHGASASAGLTGANFALSETGTVVLESTDEAVRIATTLPEKHFVILDPVKILESADAAVPLIKKFHDQMPKAYLAYITGPSRTADIERVLTIGVHGPAELHILLLEGLSDDPMER